MALSFTLVRTHNVSNKLRLISLTVYGWFSDLMYVKIEHHNLATIKNQITIWGKSVLHIFLQG